MSSSPSILYNHMGLPRVGRSPQLNGIPFTPTFLPSDHQYYNDFTDAVSTMKKKYNWVVEVDGLSFRKFADENHSGENEWRFDENLYGNIVQRLKERSKWIIEDNGLNSKIVSAIKNIRKVRLVCSPLDSPNLKELMKSQFNYIDDDEVKENYKIVVEYIPQALELTLHYRDQTWGNYYYDSPPIDEVFQKYVERPKQPEVEAKSKSPIPAVASYSTHSSNLSLASSSTSSSTVYASPSAPSLSSSSAPSSVSAVSITSGKNHLGLPRIGRSPKLSKIPPSSTKPEENSSYLSDHRDNCKKFKKLGITLEIDGHSFWELAEDDARSSGMFDMLLYRDLVEWVRRGNERGIITMLDDPEGSENDDDNGVIFPSEYRKFLRGNISALRIVCTPEDSPNLKEFRFHKLYEFSSTEYQSDSQGCYEANPTASSEYHVAFEYIPTSKELNLHFVPGQLKAQAHYMGVSYPGFSKLYPFFLTFFRMPFPVERKISEPNGSNAAKFQSRCFNPWQTPNTNDKELIGWRKFNPQLYSVVTQQLSGVTFYVDYPSFLHGICSMEIEPSKSHSKELLETFSTMLDISKRPSPGNYNYDGHPSLFSFYFVKEAAQAGVMKTLVYGGNYLLSVGEHKSGKEYERYWYCDLFLKYDSKEKIVELRRPNNNYCQLEGQSVMGSLLQIIPYYLPLAGSKRPDGILKWDMKALHPCFESEKTIWQTLRSTFKGWEETSIFPPWQAMKKQGVEVKINWDSIGQHVPYPPMGQFQSYVYRDFRRFAGKFLAEMDKIVSAIKSKYPSISQVQIESVPSYGINLQILPHASEKYKYDVSGNTVRIYVNGPQVLLYQQILDLEYNLADLEGEASAIEGTIGKAHREKWGQSAIKEKERELERKHSEIKHTKGEITSLNAEVSRLLSTSSSENVSSSSVSPNSPRSSPTISPSAPAGPSKFDLEQKKKQEDRDRQQAESKAKADRELKEYQENQEKDRKYEADRLAEKAAAEKKKQEDQKAKEKSDEESRQKALEVAQSAKLKSSSQQIQTQNEKIANRMAEVQAKLASAKVISANFASMSPPSSPKNAPSSPSSIPSSVSPVDPLAKMNNVLEFQKAMQAVLADSSIPPAQKAGKIAELKTKYKL